MASTTTVSLTGNNQIDSLLSGTRWLSKNITFSFATNSSYWWGYGIRDEPYVGFQPLTQIQKNAVRSALALWSNVSGLTFQEVSDVGYSSGTIRFGRSSIPDTSWAYLPTSADYGGDVWFGTTGYSAPNSPVSGNYSFATFLHEIGHALGLKHPHELYGKFPKADIDYDSLNYSVMSYRSYLGGDIYDGYTNADDSYPQTPMLDDIAAIQELYGANFGYNSDNTVYTFLPTSGKIFQTIWDGGGNDTYDLSAYSIDLQINLNPGAWSTFSASQLAWLNQYDYSSSAIYAYGNVANAYLYKGDLRSLIENCIGGSGNDNLIGNQVANLIDGGAGNDTIDGGAGVDAIYAGDGDDTIIFDVADSYVDGGDGVDTLKAADTVKVGVTIDLTQVKYKNIENLIGSNYADKLTGTSGDNQITGGVGNDILDGKGGSDILSGGAGVDTYIFGKGYGSDTIIVDQESLNKEDLVVMNDKVTGIKLSEVTFSTDDHNLTLTTGTDSLTVEGWFDDAGNRVGQFQFIDGKYSIKHAQALETTGSTGQDIMLGTDAGETIDGGAGVDAIYAGAGDDKIIFDALDSNVDGGDGEDTLQAASNIKAGITVDLTQSKYKNIENLVGSNYADKLTGNNAANRIEGGAGNDILDGKGGNDILSGGLGVDTYIFGKGYGSDTIIVDQESLNKEDLVVMNDKVTGIKLSEVTFSTDDHNLTLTTGTDSLTVEGWFDDAGNRVGQFQFIDGKYSIKHAQALETTGSTGQDIMLGTDAGETIDGGAGVDAIYAGAGDDKIIFDALDSNVDGGDGEDTLQAASNIKAGITVDLTQSKYKNIENLIGTNYADKLIGNSGANQLTGGTGNDILDGKGGNDILSGGAGVDTYIFGKGYGSDTIIVDQESLNKEDLVVMNDKVTGIKLSEVTFSTDDHNLTLTTGADNLTIEGWLDNAGNRLNQFQFIDGKYGIKHGLLGEFIGSTGQDIMLGTSAGETIDGGAGVDAIYAGDGDDKIIFDALDSNVDGGDGEDTLQAASNIKAGITVDLTQSKYKNIENLVGSNYADKLTGNNAANRIEGGAGNDILDGKGGNDILSGGAGVDIYIFGKGYGSDTIVTDVSNKDDLIVMNDKVIGIKLSEVNFSTDDHNLTLTTGTDSLTVEGWFDDAGNRVGQFQFIDGKYSIKHAQALETNGSTGQDIMLGTGAGETIDGGAGVDAIYAGAGDDTIIFDAADSYVDGGDGVDTLKAASTVKAGVTIDLAQAKYKNIENLVGSNYADKLTGNNAANRIEGGAGNDILDGKGGNDILSGGAGADTYIFGKGYGSDIITSDQLNKEDTVLFKDIKYTETEFVKEDNDLKIITTSGDSLTIKDWFVGEGYQTKLQFTDGVAKVNIGNIATSGNVCLFGQSEADVLNGLAGNDKLIGLEGNDKLYGGLGNDVLIGGSGDDQLSGGIGSDTYVFGLGDGHDTIIGDAENYWDVVKFVDGISTSDVEYIDNEETGETVVTVQSTGDSVTIQSDDKTGVTINQFMFNDQLYTRYHGSWLDLMMGSDSAETIVGSNNSEFIYGAKGNDTFKGSGGQDIYCIDNYSGNDIILDSAGINDDILKVATGDYEGDVVLSRSGNSLLFTLTDLNGKKNTVTLQNWYTSNNRITQFDIGDSEIYILQDAIFGTKTNNTITAKDNLNTYIRGDGGNDTIYGGSGNDMLFGGDGNDSLYGGAGNDMLMGDKGDDLIVGGDGDDQIFEKYGNNSLYGGNGNDLIEVDCDSNGVSYGKSKLFGEDGNDTLWVWAQGCELDGGAGNDILDSRNGETTMYGGTGNDAYVIGNWGNNTIDDLGADTDFDTLSIQGAVNPDQFTYSKVGDDLLMSSTSGSVGTLTFKNWFATDGSHKIEQIDFGGGYVLTADDLTQRT